MEFDNSWRALTNPGSAIDFFGPPPHQAATPLREYSVVNAWWLAELSRLVYRDDGPGAARSRDQILAGVGLCESRFVRRRNTQCAIVEPRGGAAQPVAVLVFRGTDGPGDWGTNFKTVPTEWPQGGTVHAGFKRALDGIWPDLEPLLDALDTPVFYAGHSLGGALAMLAASRRPPLAVYTFGAPRVGDESFAMTLSDVAAYRVVNRRDSVPRLPPNVGPLRYRHAGELRAVSFGTPRKRPGRRPFPPLPGVRRSFDPPANLCDHSPVNYVACLERNARA
ncbi:MAG: lipase family protein [Thermoanaerobaculia bacterium]